MRLFKDASRTETENWKKGAILGFYTYMVLLFTDQTYHMFFASTLFSSSFIFWTGLVAAFGLQFILNIKAKHQ